jgi:hypothetical protein
VFFTHAPATMFVIIFLLLLLLLTVIRSPVI